MKQNGNKFNGMNYEEKREPLNLSTLEDRRIKEQMIPTCKFPRGHDDINMVQFFNARSESRTRGHN